MPSDKTLLFLLSLRAGLKSKSGVGILNYDVYPLRKICLLTDKEQIQDKCAAASPAVYHMCLFPSAPGVAVRGAELCCHVMFFKHLASALCLAELSGLASVAPKEAPQMCQKMFILSQRELFKLKSSCQL